MPYYTPATAPVEKQTETTEVSNSVKATDSELIKLPIDQLTPGKYQPRREMSDAGLEELSLSIQSQGIIQPIVVRLVW